MEDPETKKNNRSTRIAIIGTGPASLLKALFLSASAPDSEITLLDTASVAGGAWYSDQSPAGYEIECGCHIWSYVPKAYRFIEKELGVPLYAVKPAPVFVGKKIRVPYSAKNSADTYRAFCKTLLSLRWKRFGNFRHDPNMNFRIIGKRNRYPKSGSPELIHALLSRISKRTNITIKLNTVISAIRIQDNTAILETETGTAVFDTLYLTYVSHIGKLIINDQVIPAKHRRVDYIHFLLRTDKPLLKKMSYWRLINDPVIHRITDISYQTGFHENLVLVGIKDKAYYANDEETLITHCRNLFEKYGLTDQTFSMEKLKTHIFPTYYLDETTLDCLKKSGPAVALLQTTDLMHGFYFLLRNEKSTG